MINIEVTISFWRGVDGPIRTQPNAVSKAMGSPILPVNFPFRRSDGKISAPNNKSIGPGVLKDGSANVKS